MISAASCTPAVSYQEIADPLPLAKDQQFIAPQQGWFVNDAWMHANIEALKGTD